ncbi:MAG TPA: type 2 isopentenyl-diphosphate Delta-isomerase, partial [Candidatus Jeotgalibaca merdavium]|nr:type 2 isopentenyl-diphosphate Delta-isomerase [Candidatus Jeotgalibaca merdavium]
MTIDSIRKDEHVDLAEKQYQAASQSDFQKIRFVHHSLPQMATTDVSLASHLLGYDMPLPFYINGMTGGSDKTKVINQQLAEVAKASGLVMASGSVSAAIKHPELSDSFKVIREVNPDGIVLANLGAHHTVENAKRAVDILQANGMQIHINAPQELVMPEGDRDFSMWLSQIEAIVKGVGVPVMVKEVGFG